MSWLLALALLAVPGHDAEEGSFRVSWSAPASCAREEAVHAEIERLLRHASTRRAPVSVDAVVSGEPGAYELELAIERDAAVSSRRLSAPTCEEIVDAAALLVALAIDPTTAPVPEAPPPEPEPESPELEPEPETPKLPSTAPERAVVTKTRSLSHHVPRAVAFVDGGASVGLMPRTSGFIQAGASLVWNAVELRLQAAGWLPREHRPPRDPEVAGRFQLWIGGVSVCPVLRPHARVSIPLCAGMHAGAAIGRGTRGLQTRRQAVQPWVGVSLAPSVAVSVHRFVRLQIGAQLFVSVLRPAFDTDEDVFIHRTGAVGGAFTGGIAFGPSGRR